MNIVYANVVSLGDFFLPETGTSSFIYLTFITQARRDKGWNFIMQHKNQ